MAVDMSEAQNPRDAFIDASLWHGSLDRSHEILAAHPEIASSDLHTAAILGDDAAVRRFLDQDPGSVHRKGGPRNWDPLTYLCFSKYLRLDPARTEGFVRAATALLDAGANPNTGFFADDHQPKPEWESVLYGAAGVAHHPELTQLLLDRGADPNDAEVPYHSPETLDNRAMKILVESGKLTPASIATMLVRKFDWHDDEGVAWLLDHGADANFLTHWGHRPLDHSLSRGNPLHYFELMLDHGADPTLPSKEGPSAFAAAARKARADVLDLFERRGFAVALDPDDAFLAACARADESTARRLLSEDPGLVQRLGSNHPALIVDFAAAGNVGSVRLMLDLGFNVGSQRVSPPWTQGITALHEAANRGLLPMVEFLIERGAPLEARHRSGMTPLDATLLGLVQQSEWTPNPSSIPIANALLKAGARLDPEKLTLAAALCLGLAGDAARLAESATPKDLRTALAAAAYHGKTEAIAMLIRLGVDVNQGHAGADQHAKPLHNAVSSGSLAAVKLLVEAGAQIDAKDSGYHATPLTWAEYFAREDHGRPGNEYEAIAGYLRNRMNTSGG